MRGTNPGRPTSGFLSTRTNSMRWIEHGDSTSMDRVLNFNQRIKINELFTKPMTSFIYPSAYKCPLPKKNPNTQVVFLPVNTFWPQKPQHKLIR